MFIAINMKKYKKILFLSLLIIITFFVGVYRVFPLKYLDVINEKSKKYGLEPALVCAVIRAESSFKKDAVSYKGAKGLMQIMETTAYWSADEIGIENFDYDRILEPDINIEIGCWYLDNLKRQFGDEDVALAAYNAGSGNVSKWLRDPEFSSDGYTLDYIPYRETRNYVEKIGLYRKVYKYIIIINLL